MQLLQLWLLLQMSGNRKLHRTVTDTKPDTIADTKPDSESDTRPDPESNTNPDPVADHRPYPVADTNSDPVADTLANSGTKLGAYYKRPDGVPVLLANLYLP